MAHRRARPVRDRHAHSRRAESAVASQQWPGNAGTRQRRAMSPASPAGGPVGVALVGCGTISTAYLRNLTSFPDLRVLFCADLDIERAKAQAAAFNVPGAGTAAEAL